MIIVPLTNSVALIVVRNEPFFGKSKFQIEAMQPEFDFPFILSILKDRGVQLNDIIWALNRGQYFQSVVMYAIMRLIDLKEFQMFKVIREPHFPQIL